MKIDLNGKIALVTGARTGIGLEVVRVLASAGAKVALNYVRDKDSAEAAAQELRDGGAEVYAFQADVSNVEQIERMLAEVQDKLGGTVDILVNNAGGMVKRVPNVEMTEAHYEQVMDINFKSAVFMSKAVLPGMIAKKNGAIVNMSSVAAHDGGGAGASIYAASKAAVISYSKGLAKEVAASGIRVNAVSPGFIGQTPFHVTHTPEAARNATVARVPLGREGIPQDVANAVLFLASELSSYLTGETIEINGGLFMR